MILNESQLILLLVGFGGALYFTWKKAEEKGYDEGYHDACYDVAHGNIKVTLEDNK